MTTQEVAHRLIELVKTGESEKAIHELYSPNIESKEVSHMGPLHLKGLEAILGKHHQMQENMEEFHSITVSEPIFAGKFFSCTMHMDAKMKGMERMMMEEVCVYKVEDGKVVSEEFFY